MSKSKPNTETKLCTAALPLIAKHGWSAVTLDQIAKSAKIPAAEIPKTFISKDGILAALVRYIDDEVVAVVGKTNRNASEHDRIFEVMMARFDILQKYRKAIQSIMSETKKDPRMTRYLVPAQIKAMTKMLTLAGFKYTAGQQQMASMGLLVVYGLTACAWQKDSSADMAKTMAALDRNLKRMKKGTEILFRAF